MHQIHTVTKSNLVNNPIRNRDRCVLCQQSTSLHTGNKNIIFGSLQCTIIIIVIVTSFREQSTHTNPVIQVSTKRRRKKPKSYAEILEGK